MISPNSTACRIVAGADFAGMERPYYREWFHDADGSAGFYWIGDDATHVATDGGGAPVGFRCAQSTAN